MIAEGWLEEGWGRAEEGWGMAGGGLTGVDDGRLGVIEGCSCSCRNYIALVTVWGVRLSRMEAIRQD